MENFDLNLDNYGLEEILKLFHVNYNLDEKQMKKAKLIALKTHPDKSGLDKSIFLFFMKAYKMLEAIYEYRVKTKRNEHNLKYSKKLQYDKDDSNENILLLKKLEGKSAKEFNSWFNEMFEKVKVNDNDVDTGYGTWFKSNEDVHKGKINNLSQMSEAFKIKKAKTRELVLHKDIKNLEATGGYSLTRDKPELYCSDLFSKLKYEDLKKAHTETVVPVTQEDYNKKMKFESVDSYLRYRNNTEPSMISLNQSKKLLNERNKTTDKINSERAYKLIKRDQEIADSNKRWWANLKQLSL